MDDSWDIFCTTTTTKSQGSLTEAKPDATADNWEAAHLAALHGNKNEIVPQYKHLTNNGNNKVKQADELWVKRTKLNWSAKIVRVLSNFGC